MVRRTAVCKAGSIGRTWDGGSRVEGVRGASCGIVSVVCRRLCMRVQFFCPPLTVPCAGPRADLQKADGRVYPVASSQAINEATHIEWLHKEGVVEGCRCRRPIAKSQTPVRFVESCKIRLWLNSGFLPYESWGIPDFSSAKLRPSLQDHHPNMATPQKHPSQRLVLAVMRSSGTYRQESNNC